MTALAKYRDQVKIARDTGTFVVQTVDEAQALLDEITPALELRAMAERIARQPPSAESPEQWAERFGKILAETPSDYAKDQPLDIRLARTASGPPYEGDDEHA